ncbi:MAG: Crp/Fnr family transcriptional regulator [Magnetospirillum sp.]|nr:Crp/Fnr family transcriptional regulator [Magnetospirillum sp.]
MRGSTFFNECDDALHCRLLVAGRIKLVQTSTDGNQVVTRFVAPGEMFGWAQVLGASVYPGSAEAMVDSVALTWDAASMRSALAAHPVLALNALELLGARLREAQDRLREVATERVERRVARALLRLARQSARPTGEGVEIGFPVTRQDLAETTGATLHTVSRILAAWEHSGILAGSRQRIVLLHPGRLETLAEDGG